MVVRAGGLIGGGQGGLPTGGGGSRALIGVAASGIEEAEGKAGTAEPDLAHQLRLVVGPGELQQQDGRGACKSL